MNSTYGATYICCVARRAKEVAWEMIKLSVRGVLLAVVYEEDEAAARKTAIVGFKIWPVLERALLIRKV